MRNRAFSGHQHRASEDHVNSHGMPALASRGCRTAPRVMLLAGRVPLLAATAPALSTEQSREAKRQGSASRLRSWDSRVPADRGRR